MCQSHVTVLQLRTINKHRLPAAALSNAQTASKIKKNRLTVGFLPTASGLFMLPLIDENFVCLQVLHFVFLTPYFEFRFVMAKCIVMECEWTYRFRCIGFSCLDSLHSAVDMKGKEDREHLQQLSTKSK